MCYMLPDGNERPCASTDVPAEPAACTRIDENRHFTQATLLTLQVSQYSNGSKIWTMCFMRVQSREMRTRESAPGLRSDVGHFQSTFTFNKWSHNLCFSSACSGIMTVPAQQLQWMLLSSTAGRRSRTRVVIHTDAPERILIFNVKCSLVFPPRRNSREISMLQSDMAS